MKFTHTTKKEMYIDEVFALARKENWTNKKVVAKNYANNTVLPDVALFFNADGRMDTSKTYMSHHTWNLDMKFEIEVVEEIEINSNHISPVGTVFTEVRYVDGKYKTYSFKNITLQNIVDEDTNNLLSVYWDKKDGSMPIKLWDKDLGFLGK